MTEEYTPPKSLKPGYFLGQEASSLPKNVPARALDPYFKQFTSPDRGKRYFSEIAGKVDGLDYVAYWYEQADAELHRAIAEVARSFGIDMWTGIRWHKQFRDLPVVPGDCVAWTMEDSGKIVPYLWEQRNHIFDYLNPSAVDWLLDVLETRYWPHVKGVVNGLLLPETSVAGEWPNRHGLKSWKLRAYSPYVLDQWRKYCDANDVRYEGTQVDRFPVPRPHMTAPNPNETIYVPDDRPENIPGMTRFSSIPRGPEVWLAWEEFLCNLFHRNFIHRVAARVNRYNADVKDWRGVCYFSMDSILLDYRDFQTPAARAGWYDPYWPQGRRCGVDVRRILRDPEITCVIQETVCSVKEYYFYDENCLSTGMRLARETGRERDYGFLLHGFDHWGVTGDSRTPGAFVFDDIEDDLRWEVIAKHRPGLISAYSIPAVLTSEGAWYNKDAADRFWRRVTEYKSTCT